MTTRPLSIVVVVVHALLGGLAAGLAAQPPQDARPCDQITGACKAAGFTQGSVGTGTGLQLDCVIPIMQGTAQPPGTALPLPHVAPQVVAACKALHPDFGQGRVSTAPQPATRSPEAGSAGTVRVLDSSGERPRTAAEEAHKTAAPEIQTIPPVTDDQLVYDGNLNVYWLVDGNLAAKQTFGVAGINASGSMDYATAVRWVLAMNASNSDSGYLGHKNWQLPTTPENDRSCDRTGMQGESFGFHCEGSALGSLYYRTLGIKEPNTAVPIPSNSIGPFSDVQPYLYWSSSAAANPSQGFVSFSFNTGYQGANVGRNHLYVLPVLKGKLAGTTSTGEGLQADPGAQTVYDPLSQVTWLADADLAATQTFGVTDIAADGSMDHATAVLWIAAMNKADGGRGYLGQTHWQLPDTGPSDPSCSQGGTTGFGCTGSAMGKLYYEQLGLPAGKPAVSTPNVKLGSFRDIQPYLYWSCAAPTVRSTCQTNGPASGFEWNFSFGSGFEGTNLVGNYLYVIVYFPAPLKPSHGGLIPLAPSGGG
jgi:hypothetical protein